MFVRIDELAMTESEQQPGLFEAKLKYNSPHYCYSSQEFCTAAREIEAAGCTGIILERPSKKLLKEQPHLLWVLHFQKPNSLEQHNSPR